MTVESVREFFSSLTFEQVAPYAAHIGISAGVFLLGLFVMTLRSKKKKKKATKVLPATEFSKRLENFKPNIPAPSISPLTRQVANTIMTGAYKPEMIDMGSGPEVSTTASFGNIRVRLVHPFNCTVAGTNVTDLLNSDERKLIAESFRSRQSVETKKDQEARRASAAAALVLSNLKTSAPAPVVAPKTKTVTVSGIGSLKKATIPNLMASLSGSKPSSSPKAYTDLVEKKETIAPTKLPVSSAVPKAKSFLDTFVKGVDKEVWGSVMKQVEPKKAVLSTLAQQVVRAIQNDPYNLISSITNTAKCGDVTVATNGQFFCTVAGTTVSDLLNTDEVGIIREAVRVRQESVKAKEKEARLAKAIDTLTKKPMKEVGVATKPATPSSSLGVVAKAMAASKPTTPAEPKLPSWLVGCKCKWCNQVKDYQAKATATAKKEAETTTQKGRDLVKCITDGSCVVDELGWKIFGGVRSNVSGSDITVYGKKAEGLTDIDRKYIGIALKKRMNV